MRYVATIRVMFDVEFDDDGDLCLIDQAHEEAISFLPIEFCDDVQVVGAPRLILAEEAAQ